MSSQYPVPYFSPGLTSQHQGPVDALRPARRASVLMFIIGPLMILFSGCMIGLTFAFSMIPPEKFNPLRDKIATMTHLSPELFFRTVGTLVMIVGIVLFTLGFFVRRGGVVSAILSTIIVGLIALQQLIAFIAALTAPMDIDGLGNLVGSGITLSLFALLFISLINAARAAPKVKFAQQQYQAQYWQYQQNMQGHLGYPTQPLPQGYATANEPPAAQ